jgi:hypothetical protein
MLDTLGGLYEITIWTVALGVVLVVGVVWLAWKFVAAVIKSRREL